MDLPLRPRLRAVEIIPTEHEGKRLLALHDPAGLANGMMTVSQPALFILSRFDGEHSLLEIQVEFQQVFGQTVKLEQLQDFVKQLDEGHFLEGPGFDTYVGGLVEAYRTIPTRQTQPDAGLGVQLHELPMALGQIVREGDSNGVTGSLVGLVAPHLDLRRGRTCYADAYSLMGRAKKFRRFVILGTNHFGQSPSVTATGKSFETPLGTTPVDRDFLDRLNRRCGADLCENEFDHKREHSVEIQVLFLQYLLYREPFSIVPVLCPDPCGPTGTKPYNGHGVDLREFAEALGDELRNDPTPTCVIAGADLSHVGRRFGDDRDLEEPFLREVEVRDRRVLRQVEGREPEAFRQAVAEEENPTHICSAGCIYTLMTALNRAYDSARLSCRLLRYHQAVDAEMDTGVTCAAIAFTLNDK
jgi:AmmeMemoRadiSam system protein B